MKVFLTGASGFIGTHFIEELRSHHPKAEILNLDLEAPKLKAHQPFWVKGSIMHAEFLLQLVKEFAPTHVIHMAARTDPDGMEVKDYAVNTEGSANLIASLKQVDTIQRTVFISTQYVVRPGPLPTSDNEYRPVNAYGESKSIMEEMIRHDQTLPGIWTIVRPTNIWGPWHPRYAQEFWLVVKKGQYIHPGGKPVVRAYGYVGNVVEYLLRILNMATDKVHGKTFYVGDPVDDIKTWVSAFSISLTGRPIRVVPRLGLKTIAFVGDTIRLTGRSFPLFTSRYKSMTQNYAVNMEPTFTTLGPPRYKLDQGVKITVDWLKTQDELWRS